MTKHLAHSIISKTLKINQTTSREGNKMSQYQVYSPITKGELVLAALEIVRRTYNYFAKLKDRGNVQEQLQQATHLLQFRHDEKNQSCSLNSELRGKISEILRRFEQIFGAPWQSDDERLNRVTAFWLLESIIQARVEAPQYSHSQGLFGGQPFLLSKERLLVGELFAGNIDDQALISRINSELGPEKALSPHKTYLSIFGACRNFQKGLATANLGDHITGVQLAVRSFLVFLPTMFLWWRNNIVEFLFDNGIREELVRSRKNDFAVELLLEEFDRQSALIGSVDKFNADTNNALADLLEFDWLNSPCEQAAESQILVGLARKDEVWWKPYRKN